MPESLSLLNPGRILRIDVISTRRRSPAPAHLLLAALLPVLSVMTGLVACTSSTALPTATPEPTVGSQLPTLIIGGVLFPERLSAGELFSVTSDSGGAGLPQFTPTIGDHLRSIVRYDTQLVSETSDGVFTVSAWNANTTGASWDVRANVPGQYAVEVFVTGEIGIITQAGPHFFTGGTLSYILDVE